MEISPGPLALTASKQDFSHNFAASCCFTVVLIRLVKQSVLFQLAKSRSSMDKIRQNPCRTGQLDAAGCRNSGVHQNAGLVATNGPNACKQVAKKKPCRGMRNQSDFLKSMVCFSNRQLISWSFRIQSRWSFGGMVVCAISQVLVIPHCNEVYHSRDFLGWWNMWRTV